MATTTHLSMRPSVRLFITLLATVSILASQMVAFSPFHAFAEDHEDDDGEDIGDLEPVGPGVDGLDFEIDGNFTPSSGAVQDWVDRDYTMVVDSTDPHYVFAGGSKFSDRAGWAFTTGNAPGKADILRLYSDIESDGNEAWLRVAAERDGTGGNTWVSFELNQNLGGPYIGDFGIPLTPAVGDLLVTFGYPGQGTTSPEVRLERWDGSAWALVPNVQAYAAVNLAGGGSGSITDPNGRTVQARRFLELSIDVSFLFGPDAPCRSFGQGWAFSRSSDSGPTSQMQDVINPFPFGFDTCASASLQKVDEQDPAQPLAGAEFAVYEGDSASGSPILECTTGEDGFCDDPNGVLDKLEPGKAYTFEETVPPRGHRFSPESPKTITPEQNESLNVVFSNPPITYMIDVDPEDETNAVGFTHDFKVTLTADFIFDYATGEVDDESDAADIPLAGETVTLVWTPHSTNGPDDSAIVAVRDADDDPAREYDPGVITTTCETDADGTCTVTVLSNDVGGPGTLTATYATPLSGPAASDPAHTTAGGYFSSISDSGDKSWIGYQVSLSPDHADNPLDVPHTFTATVQQVNADGTTSPAGEDVTVSFGWVGPDGSSLDATSCVTGGDSTCQVTASSPDGPGTGTIHVTSVSGDIVDGETLTMTFENDEVTATKTWWDYQVSVIDTATNPVSEEHTFDVSAQRTDGSLDGDSNLIWEAVPDGTTVDFEWEWHGDDAEGKGEVTSETCLDGGTTNGQCTVTVSSSIKGTGTLTVTGIAGTTLPGYNLDDGVEQPFAFETANDDASKTWVDWIVDITPDAFNPAGTSHTFRVDVQVWDDVAGEYVDAEDGTLLTFDYSDPTLVSDDSDCTGEGNGTVDGSCTIEAHADTAAQLTVTVTGIAGTPLTGYPDGSATYTFPVSQQAESTKQWIEYRILPDQDATNYVSEDHTFTLTVQQTSVDPDGRDDSVESADWTAVPNGTVLDIDVADGGVGSIIGGTCTDATVGTVDGECTVMVTSGGTPGSLTVVADGLHVELFDGTDDTVFPVEVADAEQTKTWVDYLVEFEAPATNLLGDDHDFDVTVYRITGYDETDAPITELAEGVDITLCWDGNLGSGLVGGDGDDCVDVTTGTGDDAGVATVTVSSPSAPTSGTLSIAALTSDGDVELPEDGVTEFHYVNEREEAEKSWVAFRVSVTPDAATNLVDDGLNEGTSQHDFTVHVQISTEFEPGPTGDPSNPDTWWWDDYAGATIDVEDGDQVSWTLPGGWSLDDVLTGSTCDAGTDANGTCTITVDSDEVGTVTLEVLAIGIPGSEVDSDDEVVLVGTEEGLITSFTVADLDLDATGEKTWVQYAAAVYADAVNLVGDDHTFLVQITRTPDGTTGVNGVEVAPDWELGGDTTTLGTCTTGAWDTDEWGDRGGLGDGADGWCAFTVSDDGPGEGTLSVNTLVHDGDVELAEGYEITIDEASASKTWIVFDVEVSGDAVNNLGEAHDFVVTVRMDDGDGEGLRLVDGAEVDGTFRWTEPDGADVPLSCETGEGGADTGTCVMTVQAPTIGGDPVAGEGALTLEQLSFTYDGYDAQWPFTIDLTDEDADGLIAGFATPTSTKVWAAYTLDVSPPADINLLPGNEDHTFTVTLGSDDGDVLPVGGQELDLQLTSDVVTTISVVDADGTATYTAGALDEITEDGVASFTCTTFEDGTCEVTVTTSGAGTATLTADFSTEIGEETFAAEQAQGDKTWTTYRILIDNTPAVNLLGTPHVFGVTLEKTDGDRDSEGDLVWYGVSVDGDDLDISLSGDDAFVVDTGDDADCAEGTDDDGFCTVTIDSTSTGVFVLTVEYEAENITWAGSSQSAGFSETGTKQWIDFEVNVTPDTADNLVDTDHVFQVEVLADIGDGFEPIEGAMPDIDVDGVGIRVTSEDDDCADGTNAEGVCFVTITSSVPGQTTVTATYTGSTEYASTDTTVGDPEQADFVDSGDKFWIDYTIEVDPQAAINATNDPHLFTVTLERHEGEIDGTDVSFPAAGETIELTLDGPGTIVSIVEGTVGADGTTGTCTTDQNGSCEVLINSSQPGTSTLTATYDATVGDTTGTFTDNGVKDWAAISLVKEAQVDEDAEGNLVVFIIDGEPVTITYDYTITNIGPVTLTVTELDDDVMGTITLPDPLVLEPGESAVVSADYTTTEADVEAGDVVNVATVFAEAEDGTEVSAADDEQVFIVQVFPLDPLEPGVAIAKDAVGGVTDDGEGNLLVTIQGEDGSATVTYRYRITNIGDDDLMDLTLVDDKIGDLTDPLTAALEATFGEAVLPMGQTITVIVEQEVTSDDFDGITLLNVAEVVGIGVEGGGTASAQDDETVVLIQVLDVVEEAPRQLPRTGLNGAGLIGLGLLLAMLGAAALLFTRRREEQEA